MRGIATIGVQYPGRLERYQEPFITDVETCARVLAPLIAEVDAGNLAFFGHSLGALIAFETALLLDASGFNIPTLFLSGHEWQDSPCADQLYVSTDETLLHAVREMGGPGIALFEQQEFRELVFPILRADLMMAERYICREHKIFHGNLYVIAGDVDPYIDQHKLERWEKQCRGKFQLSFFPGGHFYLEDNLTNLADNITGALSL
ncbi:hypothetical protein HA50_16970 [Pantoea cypripedii]|uniref:Thioesterase domain-containing protein n=1 Tax=Pantoea cypripedii TaxID=55209 RepID=A0A1X1EYU5_PANCY|nr:hypothetical protein HA50_16970 [Pantoea cypripedii]